MPRAFFVSSLSESPYLPFLEDRCRRVTADTVGSQIVVRRRAYAAASAAPTGVLVAAGGELCALLATVELAALWLWLFE